MVAERVTSTWQRLQGTSSYLLTYLGWFAGENSWGRHYADTHSASTQLNLPLGIHLPFTWSWVPGPVRSLGSYTLDAYRFHEGLASGHPYASSQWSWLVLGRASEGAGLGNKFLANIREADAIVFVLRAFEDDDVTIIRQSLWEGREDRAPSPHRSGTASAPGQARRWPGCSATAPGACVARPGARRLTRWSRP